MTDTQNDVVKRTDREKGKVKVWLKEHRKEIILSGAVITGTAVSILAIRKYETVIEILEDLKMGMKKKDIPFLDKSSVIQQLPVDDSHDMTDGGFICDTDIEEIQSMVSRHIRNLHEGWQASEEKKAAALRKGIALEANQTWVEKYPRRCAA